MEFISQIVKKKKKTNLINEKDINLDAVCLIYSLLFTPFRKQQTKPE